MTSYGVFIEVEVTITTAGSGEEAQDTAERLVAGALNRDDRAEFVGLSTTCVMEQLT